METAVTIYDSFIHSFSSIVGLGNLSDVHNSGHGGKLVTHIILLCLMTCKHESIKILDDFFRSSQVKFN